jgi:molybdopterin molybdotransferase
MKTVEEALALVRDAAGPARARPETVSLPDALGRVLAADVRMDHDVPPFRRAAMDGFAMRAEEVAVGASFDVRGAVMAGDVPATPVAPGTAVRVMTGAPVPEGADAVVPFEWTDEGRERCTIERLPRAAENIVPRAAHVEAGAIVAQAGSVLTPALLGVLASAGCAEVQAARRPQVAVIGTGSELVPVSRAPHPGAIRNSNSAVLCAQVQQAGGAPEDLGIAADDEAGLRAHICRGLSAEVLLLSGGVSRGDLDLVPAALEAEGVRCVFHRWNVQPGGPLWFGVRGDTLVFGLPGNPAAVFVGFEVLVAPVLRTRLGCAFAPRSTLRAHYVGPWGKAGPRCRYRPVRLATSEDGRLLAHATPWKGSGDPFGLAAGEALAVLPEDQAEPAADARLVDVLPVSAAAFLWGRP